MTGSTGTVPAGREPAPASRLEVALAMLLLALGSALGCVLCAVWLMVWVGRVPVPATLLLAAAYSLVLVRLARAWSRRTPVVVLPAIVWAVTLVVLDLGPGGDMPVPPGLRGLGLLVAGVVVPLWAAFVGGVNSAAGGVTSATGGVTPGGTGSGAAGAQRR